MKLTKNENIVDRFIRIIIAELLLIISFFWLNGLLSIIFYMLAAVSLLTAISGFCILYEILKVNSLKFKFKITNTKIIIAVSFLVLIPLIGGYYSDFLTKKTFLKDYNQMNNYYKQTLFYTGQDKRPEALENYNKLLVAYPIILNKYTKYHPLVIKSDKIFNSNIIKISDLIISLNGQISTGILPDAHKKLEEIRPMFQDILKRNGFSLLAVTLVDFHDAMEKIITAADAKDSSGLISVYPEVDAKLKAVEETANDSEIKLIRQKLDEVYLLAQEGKSNDLSAKAAELKSAFIKVYLKRG